MGEKTPLFHLDFEIVSDLNLIPSVVNQIVKVFSKIFEDVYMFEVAVYEAIYNAIEHGNLEVTRSRKERMIGEGTYDDFLKKRIAKKACRHKKVLINSMLDENSFKMVIEDEGKGFNWRIELENAKTSVEQGPNQFNGYGLRIILAVFDEVFYNESGNELTLVKFRKDAGGNI